MTVRPERESRLVMCARNEDRAWERIKLCGVRDSRVSSAYIVLSAGVLKIGLKSRYKMQSCSLHMAVPTSEIFPGGRTCCTYSAPVAGISGQRGKN